MSAATWHIGDVFDVLATIPDGSVDLICTSPPFLALRSYLPADHPDKDREIGSEANPAEFLSTLLALTREWRRVLAPHGSIAVELGDTYAGGLRDGQQAFSGSAARRARDGVTDGGRPPRKGPRSRAVDPGKRDDLPGWPLERSLCGIPAAYALSLTYGWNMLDPTDNSHDRWRVRNLIAWVRPNPPVGALSDKVRPATSYVTVATADTNKCRRWFDLDAERTPPSPNTHARVANGSSGRFDMPSQQRDGNWSTLAANNDTNPAGAPLLDWWEITPGGYSGAHYAVFPLEFPRRLINLMCPRQVCTVCGQPRRRVTGERTIDTYRDSDRPQTRRAVELADEHGLTADHIAAVRAVGVNDTGKALAINSGAGRNSAETTRLAAEAKAVLGGYFREFVTTSNSNPLNTWTDCGHGTWRNGIVLDPFAGSGTTLAAAVGLGRDSIGIDLDPRNADLARERVGMFLNITTPDAVA